MTDIKSIVDRSQICTRNWDHSKTIPEEHIDIFLHTLQNCPSKQNFAFYKIHLITDKEMQSQILEETRIFTLPNGVTVTNSQNMANILIVFEKPNYSDTMLKRNEKYTWFNTQPEWELDRDSWMNIGVAAGYLNYIAHSLGYETGYCAGLHQENVKNIIGCENNIELMMGIGFRDMELDQRDHHFGEGRFPHYRKEPIIVERHE